MLDIIVELANGTEREIATKEQLLALLKKYDLRKWLFTERVRIEQGAVPHSHPVPTLNTRYLHNDSQLLATFIHEQLHWLITMNQSKADAAIAKLRELYPKVPVGQPEGARDEDSTYLHLIVCYLEYQALIELLGEAEANRVFDFSSGDRYTWIYKTVRADVERIRAVAKSYGLALPEAVAISSTKDYDSNAMTVRSFDPQEYLSTHSEILAVYLFGSHAEGCARSDSDIDIAVLLHPDIEPAQYPDCYLRLLDELSDFFPRRLDLIILNQAPPLLQFQVLQKGQLLFDRDPDQRAEAAMYMLSRYYDARRYYTFHFDRLMEKIKREGLGHGHPRHSS